MAFVPELLYNLIDVDGIPNDDRIDDQVQSANLMEQLLILLRAQLRLIGKEQVSAQTMQCLALIELSAHLASLQWIAIPAQDMNRSN